ncbi:nucleolus and neural progenitor protein [Eudromia elegans]
MAAPTAAWNRLDVAWPAGGATVAVPGHDAAARSARALRRRCEEAGGRLRGRAARAEAALLRSVLRAYRRSLRRHRPFQALRQVEQCLGRMERAELAGCLEALAGLLPRGGARGPCSVPGRAVLETAALRVLGGCRLVVRLLECCSKAFLLSVQHLCSGEFILLNTVASGLLSRLRVQYRWVLQSLVSLYEVLWTLLDLVSKTQQTPYIKGFTFPSDIGDFLGASVCAEVKKMARAPKGTKAARWLRKLFPDAPEAAPEAERDLGISITSAPSKVQSVSLCSRLAKSPHARSLVQMFQKATSFGELSEALRKAILWCKGNKLKSAAYFLRNKLLKSNRLHHVEAQGCSLQKKLCCVKTSLCKYLLCGSQNARQPKLYHRARLCQGKMRCSRRSKTPKAVQQEPPELPGACEGDSSSFLSIFHAGFLGHEGRADADEAGGEQRQAGPSPQLLLGAKPGSLLKEAAENMDIDSIFAAMGV